MPHRPYTPAPGSVPSHVPPSMHDVWRAARTAWQVTGKPFTTEDVDALAAELAEASRQRQPGADLFAPVPPPSRGAR